MYIAAWIPNHQYYHGDSVVHNGRVFRVIQPHRSQSDWAPDVTPSLWGAGQYITEDSSEHSFYTPPPGPPPAYPEPFNGVSMPDPGIQGGKVNMPGFPSMPRFDHAQMPTYPPMSPFFPNVDHVPSGQFPQANPRSPVAAEVVSPGGRHQSSADWIRDAKARTQDFNMSGPKGPTTWILAERGQIPEYAIIAGRDENDDPLYAARNFHEGGLHLGWAGKRGASMSWGGGEIPLATYEVLTGDPDTIHWVSASSGGNARPVEGGYEADGKPLWIAQAMFSGKILPGKTAGWDSGAYIAHRGTENVVMDYNVLVYR